MVSTQLISERPSTPPASVAARMWPVSVLPVSPAPAFSAPCVPATSVPSVPAATYRRGEGGTPVLTVAKRRPAAIEITGKGTSALTAADRPAVIADQMETKQHNTKKFGVTNVDRVTGAGGDPPRGRPI